jgi:hypothetical protein
MEANLTSSRARGVLGLALFGLAITAGTASLLLHSSTLRGLGVLCALLGLLFARDMRRLFGRSADSR